MVAEHGEVKVLEDAVHGLPAEHATSCRATSRRRLWAALALVGGYMVVEVVAGLVANSLGLLADAGHMITDAAAISLALFAMWLAERPASGKRTYGLHRSEVLAALLNAVGLWVIAGWVFYEAQQRFVSPPEVQGVLVLSVGMVGLLVNVAGALILRCSAKESLNVEGAFVHILGDLLGSIGAVTAGLLIVAFGWHLADPILGVVIGILILVGSTRLLYKTLHVLMEGTPFGLDLQQLCSRFEQEPGVSDVHDIHAWSITSGYEVLSAHVTADVDDVAEADRLLRRLRDIGSREFGIAHVTIQLESSREGCTEAHHIDHPVADEEVPGPKDL